MSYVKETVLSLSSLVVGCGEGVKLRNPVLCCVVLYDLSTVVIFHHFRVQLFSFSWSCLDILVEIYHREIFPA